MVFIGGNVVEIEVLCGGSLYKSTETDWVQAEGEHPGPSITAVHVLTRCVG